MFDLNGDGRTDDFETYMAMELMDSNDDDDPTDNLDDDDDEDIYYTPDENEF